MSSSFKKSLMISSGFSYSSTATSSSEESTVGFVTTFVDSPDKISCALTKSVAIIEIKISSSSSLLHVNANLIFNWLPDNWLIFWIVEYQPMITMAFYYTIFSLSIPFWIFFYEKCNKL